MPKAYQYSTLSCLACNVQQARPRAILDLITSGESFRIGDTAQLKLPTPGNCMRCNYISSQPVCKACVLLEGLNSGQPRLGVARTRGSKKKGTPPPTGATPLPAVPSQTSPASAALDPAGSSSETGTADSDERAGALYGASHGASNRSNSLSGCDNAGTHESAGLRHVGSLDRACSCRQGACGDQSDSSRHAVDRMQAQLDPAELAAAVETSGVGAEESGVFASAASLVQISGVSDQSATSINGTVLMSEAEMSDPAKRGDNHQACCATARDESEASSQEAQSTSALHAGSGCCAGSCREAANDCSVKGSRTQLSPGVAACLNTPRL